MQPGSLLECIVNDIWYSNKSKKCFPGPAYKEIVTFEDEDLLHNGWIYLLEYSIESDYGRLSYPKNCFIEIQPPIEINIEELLTEKV